MQHLLQNFDFTYLKVLHKVILLSIKGTLMHTLQCTKGTLGLYIKNNMPKVSHYSTFCLRHAHPRYEKCLFTNIHKQRNMLKISLIFTKNTNFTGITRTCFPPPLSFSPPLLEILSPSPFTDLPSKMQKGLSNFCCLDVNMVTQL